MFRSSKLLATLVLLLASAAARAAVGPAVAQKIYEDATPSLVAVQYTWESELGRREIIGSGVIIGQDGLVVASIGVFHQAIPDEQMKDFKILVPKQDDEAQELDAVFLGRDERTNLAFLKTKEPQKWKVIQFQDLPVTIGQTVLSVGLLPKQAGYRSYFAEAVVSATLRGEVPSVMVSGPLAALGSPVFTEAGKAIGLVCYQLDQQVVLNDPREPLKSITNPPFFFVPTRDFVQSFSDLPKAGEPAKLPWLGVTQLTGLKKDVAEFFGLKGTPAVEIGDVIAGGAADKAGLKRGMVIVKVNGQPLERGDEPEELPAIFRRKILRMNVGDQVTLSVMTEKHKPLKDVRVTLLEQPMRANLAKRYFAEDLGFTARQVVFHDTYQRKLPADTKGVIIALVKPQSSAQTARLQNNDLVTEMNGKALSDVDSFKTAYEQFRKDRPREAVVLVILREGKTQVIRIEPPQ